LKESSLSNKRGNTSREHSCCVCTSMLLQPCLAAYESARQPANTWETHDSSYKQNQATYSMKAIGAASPCLTLVAKTRVYPPARSLDPTNNKSSDQMSHTSQTYTKVQLLEKTQALESWHPSNQVYQESALRDWLVAESQLWEDLVQIFIAMNDTSCSSPSSKCTLQATRECQWHFTRRCNFSHFYHHQQRHTCFPSWTMLSATLRSSLACHSGTHQ